MGYSEPRLPDFCRLRGSSSRNRWNESVEQRRIRRENEAAAAAEASARNSATANVNANLMDNSILYNRVYYRQLFGGYLPGEDSNYALNNSLQPDGNNLYSNTGLDGQLIDSKKRYYKSYATTIHLSLGILLSLFIIIKKPSPNI